MAAVHPIAAPALLSEKHLYPLVLPIADRRHHRYALLSNVELIIAEVS
jgi:hypothetical protein